MDEYKHERDVFFDKVFKKSFGRMEDHQFKGWNNALNCFIQSKEHYKAILKSRGLLPFDGAEQVAEEYWKKAERNRNIPLSDKTRSVIKALKDRRRKDGTVEIRGRLLEAMIEIGAINDISPYEPSLV